MRIIQFSPIRTGSTLIYNILKEIMGENVEKLHHFSNKKQLKYIVTIRHPYNSIISSILRYEKEINEKILYQSINEYLKNGGNDILNHNLNNFDNILLLRYENFNNNIDYIIDNICNFFNVKINEDKKNKIKNNYNKKSVNEKIKQFKHFGQYCKKTHLHGLHISKYNGETDYNKILDDKLLNILKNNNILNNIIKLYNY